MNTLPACRFRKPVVLIGMPTCGKTTIGHAFGAHHAIPFNDSDSLIAVQAGKSISLLFAEEGETRFRERERAVLERLLAWPNSLIAAGGGAFAHESTRALLLEQAHVVWLYVEIATLQQRLTAAMTADRPLLQGGDALERLEALWRSRAPLYALAPARLDITGFSVWESLQRLKQHLQNTGIMLEENA